MAETIQLDEHLSKEEKYKQLLPQIAALMETGVGPIANLANMSAALKAAFNFWWVGFYIVQNDELILGPFQGPVACTRIAMGKGVCGTSWEKAQTIIVPDVDAFPGHIACSADSKSEIVVPLFKEGKVWAVLDVDSEFYNQFDDVDKKYLETMLESLSLVL